MAVPHSNPQKDVESLNPSSDERFDYDLLDLGRGRKLERFGAYVLDRPAIGQAEGAVERPELWSRAAARFELDEGIRAGSSNQRGHWAPVTVPSPGVAIPGLNRRSTSCDAPELPERWVIACGASRMELKPTDFGHVGFFPEQIENWLWIAGQIRQTGFDPKRRPASDTPPVDPPLKILNLFAHTGGSTVAAAAAGAEVVHVDSARGAVAWARRNAELSGLVDAPIRWIVEDASRFVRRELARGNGYDAVILDPPSYGHGAAGETWKLERDLPELLAACVKLTAGRLRFLLLSCHSPAATPPVVGRWLSEAAGASAQARELTLATASGRKLSAGVVAHVIGDSGRSQT